jgi:predicted metalloprotease
VAVPGWRRRRQGRCRTATTLLIALALTIGCAAGCTSTIAGQGQINPLGMPVHGDSGDRFDNEVKIALADVTMYWQDTYPTIAHGAKLPPLKGGLYSVDGANVVATNTTPSSARGNKCLQRRLSFIVDNAAYCQLDDSIIWDRGTDHLLPVLTQRYGPTLTALVFAHEFGHAVQHRLHIDVGNGVRTIDIESQADCAAGAFAGAALAGKASHVHITTADLDRALDGYFQVRDSTPDTPSDATHGNGFDRINALQLGIEHGARYCFSPSYLHDRTYTERGYVDPTDYYAQGNQPLAVMLSRNGIAPDLNRFWLQAGSKINETFHNVRLARADHPQCGSADAASQFGYCPNDNTVYYSNAFAQKAYYSITDIVVNRHDATVSLQPHQPGDYALGFLMAVAWGMAARAQFFHRSTTDHDALVAAICYAGAYSEDINRAQTSPTHKYVLSPPDMDEATAAALGLVDLNTAFGARGTTGLDRVRAFVNGYTGGLASCR